MSQMIFVNLPVTDLPRSIRFFEGLGYKVNPNFTDETAACIVISEMIYAMLLTHAKFAQFTSRKIADAHESAQVLIALNQASRAAVDELADKALAAGASVASPSSDLGFMYSRSIADPDGHIWELFWMDPAVAQGGGQ